MSVSAAGSSKSSSSSSKSSPSSSAPSGKASNSSTKSSGAQNTTSDSSPKSTQPSEEYKASTEVQSGSVPSAPSSRVSSILAGLDGSTATKDKAKAPDPSTPEYGQDLRAKLEDVAPELASKLDPASPGKLSPEDVNSLTDIVSSSPELGGLEGYVKSATVNGNGYAHGWESGKSLEAFGETLGRSVVPDAQAPNEVSHNTIDAGGFKRNDDLYAGYVRGLDGQPNIREGMQTHIDGIADSLGIEGKNTIQTRDGRVQESVYDVNGFRGKSDAFTVRTYDDRQNGVRNVEPGVTEVQGGVWVDRGPQGQVQLNGPELREATMAALESNMEYPDPVMKEMADKMLSLYGGAGGVEGADRVSGIYQELGLTAPGSLK